MTTDEVRQLIGYIDEAIQQQLNVILHHPNFQRLEASWRGVKMIVDTAGYNKRVQVRLLAISIAELNKDITLASEFDQSSIFNKIFSQEFDQPGGEPYGVLIGDYYFSHHINDDGIDSIRFLSQINKIAATAFVPFIAGLSPKFFGVDGFEQLNKAIDIDKQFRSKEYLRWKILRQDKDSSYLGLVMPRILMRQPYNSRCSKVEHRFFEESTLCAKNYLWGNSAYAYACVVVKSFLETGWFAHSRGINQQDLTGGVIALNRDSFTTDHVDLASKCTTEFLVTDRFEKQVSDWGFIALKDNPSLKHSIFYNDRSIYSGTQGQMNLVKINQHIASMLHYLLCACRFAHYIKVIIRDKIGSFLNTNECQRFIENWLQQYCAKNFNASLIVQARYPLSHAKVEVSEQIGKPGNYVCALNLQPYYQLDNIHSMLKLVTEIKSNG